MNNFNDEIWFVASEMAPLVKAGGLGDVIGSLPKYLIKLGMNVKVIIPAYKFINYNEFVQFEENMPAGRVYFGDIPFDFGIKKAKTKDGIPLIFVEQNHFFGRDDVYGPHGGTVGYRDNLWRFSLLAHAAVHCMKILGIPKIVHSHDWSGGLVPAVIKQTFNEKERPKIVFTIHNLGYQGVYPIDDLYDIGIDFKFNSSGAFEHFGTFNTLKGGILLSDAVTTVSLTYANEITMPHRGFGLDGELRMLRENGKLFGILNGIDEGYWNPKNDGFLYENFSGKSRPYSANDYIDWKNFKENNKKLFFSEIGLKFKQNSGGKHLPVLGIVSRLTEEKGIDVFIDTLFNWNDFPFQVLILGTGKHFIEKKALYLQEFYKDKVYAKIGKFDETLAHKIYAASDIFIMPSRTEPCGLSQMISMRYGGIILAGDTGGLHDTVVDLNINKENGNGITVKHIDAHSISWALDRLYNLYYEKDWEQFVINSVNSDFSWNASALKYIDLYNKIL